MLTVAGLQVPFNPFTAVFGKVGTVPPVQMTSEVPKAKVGAMLAVTVTVKVTGAGNTH